MGLAVGVVLLFLEHRTHCFARWRSSRETPPPAQARAEARAEIVISPAPASATTGTSAAQGSGAPALPPPVDALPPEPLPAVEEKRMPLDPKGIEKAIQNTPPFQRETVAQFYAGQRVTWRVFLQGFSDPDLTNPYVMVRSEPNQSPMIVCHGVDLAQYPEFKTMKEWAPLEVEGTLERVTPDIWLKECVFRFL